MTTGEQQTVKGGWQDISNVPFGGDEVLVWIESIEDDGEGWVKLGTVVHDVPLAILNSEGREYWPHENGGYPTHWRALPPLPGAA